jgi:hypothetical protein
MLCAEVPLSLSQHLHCGRCECAPFWHGPDCSRRGCDEDSCGAHGQCVFESSGHYACACNAGWHGHDCRLRGCRDACDGLGWCGNGTCTCFSGSGDDGGRCAGWGHNISIECSVKCLQGCDAICAQQAHGYVLESIRRVYILFQRPPPFSMEEKAVCFYSMEAYPLQSIPTECIPP